MNTNTNQLNTEPIRAVWSMVIQRAFEDATIPRDYKCPSKQASNDLNQITAISWINSKDFEDICDCLVDVSYEEIRKEMNRKLNQNKQLCQN